MDADHSTSISALRAGDMRALARAISIVENHAPGWIGLLKGLFPHTGRALTIGLTGSPGAGKSTLVDQLAKHYRNTKPLLENMRSGHRCGYDEARLLMTDGISVTFEPTSDERTMAILAQVLQLVGWWIAPLVIFLVKRESRFVSFHALQALLLQIVWMVIGGVLVVGWMALIFSTIVLHPQGSGGPPPPVFFLFPLFWLGWMVLWVGMLVLGVVYGIKAGRGEWAAYPLLGPLALRILKIAPDGTPLPA